MYTYKGIEIKGIKKAAGLSRKMEIGDRYVMYYNTKTKELMMEKDWIEETEDIVWIDVVDWESTMKDLARDVYFRLDGIKHWGRDPF